MTTNAVKTNEGDDLLREIIADASPWRQALADNGPTSDRHERLLSTLKSVLQSCPVPLPTSVLCPDADEPTARKAALHYRLANDALCAFGDPGKRRPNLTRGTLFDIWDTWWTTATGSSPELVARRIAEVFPENNGMLRRVVQPGFVLEALCSCDRDIAALLAPAEQGEGEGGLRSQIVWQMCRMHCAKEKFDVADRVVLYELLHMRHLRVVDEEQETLATLRKAVEQTSQAVLSKAGKIPWVSETAFEYNPGAAQHNTNQDGTRDDEQTLAIAAMQFIVSVRYSIQPPDHPKDNKTAIDDVIRLWCDVRKRNQDLCQLLLRLAARSRMIRLALVDLLYYEFPRPVGRPETRLDASDLCDCWISVVGHRTTGKSYFMASLTAALLPDSANLDQAPADPDESCNFWKKGRVRLIETAVFERSCNRAEVQGSAFKTDEIRNMLNQWSKQEDVGRTIGGFRNIAEIDTNHMARLRFFDFAGEEIIKPNLNALAGEITQALQDMKPAAAVIIDSDCSETNHQHEISDYTNFAEKIADKGSPIYIVINKYDEILKAYSGEALAETSKSISMSYDNVPANCDADFGENWLPFFTLRDMQFPESVELQFSDVLHHLDSAPPFVRRPYYQDRLRKDLLRLRKLIAALLKAQRTDISLLYLISARNKRSRPAEFHGHRILWSDLEGRVVRATAESRKAAIRKLLVEDTIYSENKATKAYNELNKLFTDLIPDLQKAVCSPKATANSCAFVELPRVWTGFYEKIASYNFVTHVREAENVTKRVLMARRNLIAGVEVAVRDLLPELGINPDDQFKSHDFNRARRPENQASGGEIVTKLAMELDAIRGNAECLSVLKEKKLIDQFDALIRSLHCIKDTGSSDTKVEVRYSLLNGAELPLGIAGSPAQDNMLSNPQRVQLHGASGMFGEAILSPELEPEDGIHLVHALRNASQQVRYEYLRLRPGERNFYRVRVLSEKVEGLGEALQRIEQTTEGVIKNLLSVRSDLNKIDENLLADWIIANALVRDLPPNAVASVEQLVEKDEAFAALKDLNAKAEELKREMLSEPRKYPQVLLDMYMPGAKKRRTTAWLNKYARHIKVWTQLLPMSVQAENNFQKNPSLSGMQKNEVDGMWGQLLQRIDLMMELSGAINRLRGADQEIRDLLKKFQRFSREQWPDELRPRLVRLRLMRRQLLLNYPLYMLKAGDWVVMPDSGQQPQSSVQQALIRANFFLDDTLKELELRFSELKADGKACFGAKNIGRPDNAAFEVTDYTMVINNEVYTKLVTVLELNQTDEASSGNANLWGAR